MDADDVAQVEIGKPLVGFFAQLVDLRQHLDASGVVLDVGEAGLPHHPDRDQSACERDPVTAGVGPGGFLDLFEQGERLLRCVASIEAALVWLDALRPEGLQFLTALQLLLGPLGFHSAKV